MYRTIEVGIWQELWFEELAPNAKLLFFYLLTSTRQTPCGAFRVSLRSICHETNLSAPDVGLAMADLMAINKVAWWSDTGWVLLTRFYKQQRAKASATYTVAARKAAADLPDDVYSALTTLYPELADANRGYAYPTDTLPIQETVTVNSNSKQNQEAEPAPDAPAGAPTREEPARAPKYSPAFEAFWRAYPRHENKTGAWQAWVKHAPPRGPAGELADAILAGITTWQASEQWSRGIYPHASTWLNRRQWEDEPEPAGAVRASPNGHHGKPSKMDTIREGLGIAHDRAGIDTGDGIAVDVVAAPRRQLGDGGRLADGLPSGVWRPD